MRSPRWQARQVCAMHLCLLAGLFAAVLLFLSTAGCQKGNKMASKAAPARAPNSAIVVRTEPDGIHVQTPAAEFVLSSSGYLKSNLMREGRNVTMDDPGNEPGQQLTAAGKQANNIVFNLNSARIVVAQGKLGRLGKRIEVRGTRGGGGLSETLTLEVYE